MAATSRAYRLGANAYLVKPSAFSELEEMLQVIGVFWLRLNRSLAA